MKNILTETMNKIKNTFKKMSIKSRKFQMEGGLKSFFKNFAAKLKAKNVGAICAVCAVAAAIIALPTVIMLTSNGNKAKQTNTNEVVTVNASAPVSTPAEKSVVTLVYKQTEAPTATPAPTSAPLQLNRGDEAEIVMEIQERLMELGYMDYDEPTTLYGDITYSAIKIFQRDHELEADGIIGQTTYDLLMSADAKKYMISVGSTGEDVKAMQARLRELGYSDSAADGVFGEGTSHAVMKFQEMNDLTVDGKIGENTRELLYSGEAVGNFAKYGEKSDEVLSYQKRLAKLGYLTTEPDGSFGKDTVAAVKLFQEVNGLISDGYIGLETKALLMSDDAQANALTIGMSGDTVRSVQKMLKDLKYLKTVDGYFGSQTEAAVRAMQKRNGLTVDGKVGKQTMAVLRSGKAKKASSSSSSSGSSGSSSSGSSGSSSSGSSSSGSSSSGSSSSNTSGSSVSKFIEVAKSRLGCKYVSGGKGPNTFDCSGFVYWSLNNAGVKQSYMTSRAWRTCSKYKKITSDLEDLKKGDVIVFKMSSSKGHVGIALGNGQMIHASSEKGKVVIGSCTSPYWQRTYYCAYRIF